MIKYRHNSKLNFSIKIITYKQLLYELANFKYENENELDHIKEKETDKNPEPKISMTIKNNTNQNITHVESYDFSYKDKNGNVYYDIPYYHENIPDGFSVFCTDEEHKLVLEYINKKRNKSKMKDKLTGIKKENIMSMPEPTKKNYICHLCRVIFNNYKKHINSEEHKNMILENKKYYKDLSNTFKRIVNIDNGNNVGRQKQINKNESYYCLRNKNNEICEKYFDDYILFNTRNDINLNMKNDKEIPSTAYCSLKNSSINFEEIKFK